MKQEKQKREDKIYAFIDSQNLNLGVQRSLKKKVDFRKFRVYLKDKYKVEKAYLFIGHVEGNETLYTDLQEYGYILVFKPTLEHKEGKKTIIKGNVDAELVLHSMIHYSTYTKAVIVSGDGDFRCLIEYLAGKNKLEKVIVPNSHYSSLLKEFSKHIVMVKEFIEKVKQESNNNSSQ